MKNVFNKDGFQWFIGVVEDRDDPEKLGRCKVRIYGHNSQLKSEQPTEDLPWSVPIQPITSAAISGIGNSPIGPLPGTWVVGFYLDGNDMQQPAFFGTIGSSSAPTVFQETLGKPNFTLKDDDDNLKDQSGQTITKENKLSDGSKAISNISSSYYNVKVGSPQNPNNPELPNKPSTLPPVVNKSYTPPNARASGIENLEGDAYDSNNLITSAKQVYPLDGSEPTDIFGYRYGLFKLASYMPPIAPDGTRRPSAKTSPLQSFLNDEEHTWMMTENGLSGLEPGSEEFNNRWKNSSLTTDIPSNEKLDSVFAKTQIFYIKKTFTFAVAAEVLKMGGPSINNKSNFSFGLFSLMLNLALDHGVKGAAEIITKACEGKSNLSKEDIIELVTEYTLQNSDQLLSKLPQQEKDTIKVDQLNQRAEFKKFEIPPFNPTTAFGDYGSGFNLSVGLEGTPDEKLTYNGNDPTVYDRINNERIRRGLPGLTNPRPTGEGNREVRSTFGGTTDRFGNRITSEE